MSDTETFVIASDTGADIHGVLHHADRPGRRPTVIVCHGFKGFMDWGFFPPLAELLASRGFTVIRFNYTGIGQRPGDDMVTDLDAFRRNTHSQELAETLRIVRAAGTEIAPERVDVSRIGLVGHSRGGGAAILAAAHDDARTQIRALVTWAAVATFDRFPAEAKAQWRRDGELTIANARTGQQLPLGIGLLDDIEQNAAGRLDIEAAAARLIAPWLIVHGAADETVSADDARRLDAAATSEHRLFLVEGENAGHTFGATHPFTNPTPELIEVFNATQRWLRRHL